MHILNNAHQLKVETAAAFEPKIHSLIGDAELDSGKLLSCDMPIFMLI